MAIAILGTKTSCLRIIEALVDQICLIVTVDDRLDARTRLDEIVNVANRQKLKVTVASSKESAYDAIIASKPDVVFVCGWYWLIPEFVLNQVPNGFIGVHYSLLPSYRGSAPVVWALINGESEVGFSIFRLTTEMDEGPIALQGLIEVGAERDVSTILERLDHASVQALARLAPALSDGTHHFDGQASHNVSYGGHRRPTDGFVDWTLTADKLERFILAQSHPYPGARSMLDSQLVRIWRAHTDPAVRYYGQPGQVVRLIEGKPVVACGQGTGLILDEVDSDSPLSWRLTSSRLGTQSS